MYVCTITGEGHITISADENEIKSLARRSCEVLHQREMLVFSFSFCDLAKGGVCFAFLLQQVFLLHFAMTSTRATSNVCATRY